MKMLSFTESTHLTCREPLSIRSPRPTRLIHHFKRYIETSDWDLRIIRLKPLFDAFCIITVILSGLILSPIILNAFLK